MQKEEVVILGNGFDLSCGIKSSYNNFYNKRYYDKYENNEIIIGKDISKVGASCEDICSAEYEWDTLNLLDYEKSITFWDLAIFSTKKKVGSWQDFESFIKDTLIKLKKTLDDVITKIKIKSFSNWSFDAISEVENKSESDNHFLSFLALRMKHNTEDYVKDITYENISDFLLKELIKFESCFCEYLSIEVSQPSLRYNDKSISLLKKVQKNVSNVISNVVTFNYTSPKHVMNYRVTNGKEERYLKHVHGNLVNKNIIFGINISDSKLDTAEKTYSNFNDPFFRKFTKTYRTLSLVNEFPLYSSKTEEIKFFGHSLGDADFSYFKVMFDSLDLYNGKLKLKFYYSDYTDKIDIKSQQIEFVTHLLKEYEEGLEAENIENIPYSGYIFDKLRTQGRLSIIRVDNSEL